MAAGGNSMTHCTHYEVFPTQVKHCSIKVFTHIIAISSGSQEVTVEFIFISECTVAGKLLCR
jgi:hypothetical protein